MKLGLEFNSYSRTRNAENYKNTAVMKQLCKIQPSTFKTSPRLTTLKDPLKLVIMTSSSYNGESQRAAHPGEEQLKGCVQEGTCRLLPANCFSVTCCFDCGESHWCLWFGRTSNHGYHSDLTGRLPLSDTVTVIIDNM